MVFFGVGCWCLSGWKLDAGCDRDSLDGGSIGVLLLVVGCCCCCLWIFRMDSLVYVEHLELGISSKIF